MNTSLGNIARLLGMNMSSSCGVSVIAAELLSFPGAEGFGRYTLGDRATSTVNVYHITNLNDFGVGSLRDAVSAFNRIVVFDVSGVIKLEPTLIVKANSIIVEQTAPGERILLYVYRVSFSETNNLIVRYLPIHMSANGTSGKDETGVANGRNIIFDYVTVTWGRDENFSINWDSKGTVPVNITIRNSIIGQGLQTHSCGGLAQTDGGVTLFRILSIDNKTRNPKSSSGYLNIELYINDLVAEKTNPMINRKLGSADQTLILKDSVITIVYAFINCASVTAVGLPNGITAALNSSLKTLTTSGVPATAGIFCPIPPETLSSVNAAVPIQGVGEYEEKKSGWLDNGYYNFSNSIVSFAVWNVIANVESSAVTVIRYTLGGEDAMRNMSLVINSEQLGAISFNLSASWSTWNFVSIPIQLVKGLNSIQLTSISASDGPNLDQFEFSVSEVTLTSDSMAVGDPIVNTKLLPTKVFSPDVFYGPASGILRVPYSGFVRVDLFCFKSWRNFA